MLYDLLKPVSRTVSLLAALFSLAGCAIGAAITVGLIAPLVFLSGAPALSAFRPEQLQARAYASLRLHSEGYNIGMVNFGIYCSLLGYLVFRSDFFPRFLGVLLALAGAGWLLDSFATLLSPALAGHLDPYIMIPGFLGETGLMLWLLFAGVDAAEMADGRRGGRLDAPTKKVAGSLRPPGSSLREMGA